MRSPIQARPLPPDSLPTGEALQFAAPQPAVADREAARFGLCGGLGSAGRNCVIDGDTFWYEGEKVRIADINTPEMNKPDCAHEAELGAAATERLNELLNEGPFTLEEIDRDRDQYGRLLRTVTRDGEAWARCWWTRGWRRSGGGIEGVGVSGATVRGMELQNQAARPSRRAGGPSGLRLFSPDQWPVCTAELALAFALAWPVSCARGIEVTSFREVPLARR